MVKRDKRPRLRVYRQTGKKPRAAVVPQTIRTGEPMRSVEGSVVQVDGGFLGENGKKVGYYMNARFLTGQNHQGHARAFAVRHGYRVLP